MNFYKHHLGDYAQATAHLTFVEDAAYSRLLRKYYADERPIPTDLKAAQRLVAARTREERDAVETVLAEFFELREDGWHNKRCDEELAKAQEQAETNRRIAEEREARKRARIQHEALHESSVERATNRSTNRQPSHKPLATSHKPEEKARAVGELEGNPGVEVDERAPDPDLGAMTIGQNLVVRACTLMRQAGIPAIRMNPSHAELIAGIWEGATPEQYRDTAIEAIQAGKDNPFVWTIVTVRKRNAQAKRSPIPTGAGPPAAPKSKTRSAIEKLDRMISHAEQPTTETRLDPERIGQGNAEAALPAPRRPAAR